jgi:hypothetical protein
VYAGGSARVTRMVRNGNPHVVRIPP